MSCHTPVILPIPFLSVGWGSTRLSSGVAAMKEIKVLTSTSTVKNLTIGSLDSKVFIRS